MQIARGIPGCPPLCVLMSIPPWPGVVACSLLWLEHCCFFRTLAGGKSPETGRKERGFSDTTLQLAKISQRISKPTFLVRKYTFMMDLCELEVPLSFLFLSLSLPPPPSCKLCIPSKFISSEANPKLQFGRGALFSGGIQLQLLSRGPASSPWQHEGEW